MKFSAIEWCDHTFNPWEGCTKVSPGCAQCYAEARNKRFGGGTAPNWGAGAPRRRTSVQNWNQVRRWDREAGEAERKWDAVQNGRISAPNDPAEWHRPRVFCASLADWLDDEVDLSWLCDLLKLIHETPNLDWLLLTKRPQNFERRLAYIPAWLAAAGFMDASAWVNAWLDGAPPANVWIGTTVEDRTRADERIPQLLSIPARVRFLSCEPLLTKVEFSNVTRRRDCVAQLGKRALTGIHWVICGGESGPGARPMHPDWARGLRDQCAWAGVAFFFKQWGEWAPLVATGKDTLTLTYEKAVKGAPREPQWHRWADGGFSARIGKQFAGSLLDGVEHSEFPEVRA